MYTVLIICDDASASDVSSLRAYLELSDLKTVVCDDSRQSLSAISRNMVDIVVLVSRGGAVDGFMTIRRLREKSDMPVVVLAEHSDESDRIMAFELGCDDIISSPFSYKEIVLRYDRVVDTHIKNIRSKLGDDGRLWIGTARGYGYCFTASESTLQAR